jgi:hypothetical protein
VTTERAIDVALSLEGVSGVVAVYALRPRASDPEAWDFAVVLRPMRWFSVAEAHYRLLNVMTHEECGRVLFVDADAHPPPQLERAERLGVPAAARDAAMICAMNRVEQIAKRYEEEEAEAVVQAQALSHAFIGPLDRHLAMEQAIDVRAALDTLENVAGVYCIRVPATLETGPRLDVLVHLLAFDADSVLEAHLRVRAYCRAGDPVLYGDGAAQARFESMRVPMRVIDRIASRRRCSQRSAPPPGISGLTERIARFFAQAGRGEPLMLPIKDEVDAPPQVVRRRRLLVIDTGDASTGRLTELQNVEVVRASDPWRALDLVRETSFDLVVSALAVGEVRGVQLYRLAITARPDLKERFFFLTARENRDTAPASAALSRVLTSPLDPDEIRNLLALSR